MKRLSFLFKDVKEYNKYLLSILSIFIILLAGIISYNYTNSSYAKWNTKANSSNVLKVSIQSGVDVLTFIESKVGTDGLEIVTHTIDSTLQVGSNFATEYRYRGGDSTVKNYVTFNDETWRIIGILPTEDTDGNVEYRFKLIRDTSIGSYAFNSCLGTSTCYGTDNFLNDWTGATLNTYLNGDYYNSLSSDAQNMIGTAKYYLGGYNSSSIMVNAMWQYERKTANGSTCDVYDNEYDECYYFTSNPVVQSDVSKKIAIMYVSDYGYGASTSCTATLSNYSSSTDCNTTGNWLDKSQDEFLISQFPSKNGPGLARIVTSSGIINSQYVSYKLAVRPVLYLSSSVKITGGNGTSDSPYELSL